MNPVLDIIVRDLAHGTGASALPDAPVVAHVPGRATILRGTPEPRYRALARASSRGQPPAETAHYGRA